MHSGNDSRLTEAEMLNAISGSHADARRAEDQLFREYAYLMKEGMRRFSFSNDEAFDAFSDTVLSVIESIQRGVFERRSSLKTYIHQVYHNKCVDQLRKKKTQKESVHQTTAVTDMLQTVSDSARSILQRLIEETDIALLRQRLKQLSEVCRQMLMLSAEGRSDRELATIVGYKSADVVKTSRLRCLEKLRNLYAGRADD